MGHASNPQVECWDTEIRWEQARRAPFEVRYQRFGPMTLAGATELAAGYRVGGYRADVVLASGWELLPNGTPIQHELGVVGYA
jgi:hypothetical protein